MFLYTKLEHQETSNKQMDFFSKLYFYKNKREMISEQRALQDEFYTTTLGSDTEIDLIADFTVSCTFFVYIVKFLRAPLGTLEIPGPSESSDKEKSHFQW